MSQTIIIQNQHLKAEFNSFGAEITSIIDKRTQQEYMWQGDSEVWPRQAPILFPIVGRLKNYAYSLNGEEFRLNQHGFARDSEFHPLQQSEHSVSFLLQHNEESLKHYPFQFDFILTYTLVEKSLEQIFTIKNNSINTMPVSFGGHPAFKVEEIEGCRIRFNSSENSKATLLAEGLISQQKVDCISNNEISLDPHTFDQDAFIFLNLTSTKATLISARDEELVSVDFQEFPYLGIWSKPGAPFVCIEPWQGIADEESHDGNLENKQGLLWLSPNHHTTKTFTIRFH